MRNNRLTTRGKVLQLQLCERERESGDRIQPTRAMVARYIAVVMFDRKTMA